MRTSEVLAHKWAAPGCRPWGGGIYLVRLCALAVATVPGLTIVARARPLVSGWPLLSALLLLAGRRADPRLVLGWWPLWLRLLRLGVVVVLAPLFPLLTLRLLSGLVLGAILGAVETWGALGARRILALGSWRVSTLWPRRIMRAFVRKLRALFLAVQPGWGPGSAVLLMSPGHLSLPV